MTELRASGGKRRRKEVTGWTVFACLVAFFAVVAGVNAIMIRAAISTFGGVETESSYKAGLAFSREVAAAEAQDGRHWDVRAVVTPGRVGHLIEVTARDADGRLLANLTAVARFSHPADRRADMVLEMVEAGSGRFVGLAEPAAGQWDLVVELLRDGERVFRSRSRVVIKQGLIDAGGA
jgi:nitrogen fixation protein FixH